MTTQRACQKWSLCGSSNRYIEVVAVVDKFSVVSSVSHV